MTPEGGNEGAQRADFRFPKSHHLRKPAEFKRVYDLKQRGGDQHLLLFAAPNNLPHSRVGLSVSKKNGPSVRRQRVKRLLREAYRLELHELPTGVDFVLIPRPDSGAGVDDYRNSLRRLAQRVARKIERGGSTPPMQGDSQERGE